MSRLTARILELGAKPADTRPVPQEVPSLGAWEEAARTREEDEVRWYTAALQRTEDPSAKVLFREILTSERHHRDELAGKWMPAALTDPEEEA